MKVIVNGIEKEYQSDVSLEAVIEDLELVDKVMASAVNMEIVKKENWATFTLKEGDKLELLEFVGGG